MLDVRHRACKKDDTVDAEPDVEQDAQVDATPDAPDADPDVEPDVADVGGADVPRDDRDGDGMPETTDNCPDVANPTRTTSMVTAQATPAIRCRIGSTIEVAPVGSLTFAADGTSAAQLTLRTRARALIPYGLSGATRHPLL